MKLLNMNLIDQENLFEWLHELQFEIARTKSIDTLACSFADHLSIRRFHVENLPHRRCVRVNVGCQKTRLTFLDDVQFGTTGFMSENNGAGSHHLHDP